MNLTEHTLYHFRSCPYCIKVRLALKLMGVKLSMKNIHSNPLYKAELVQGGGKKQVPCLRIEKEQGQTRWMYESDDIIRYIRSLKNN